MELRLLGEVAADVDGRAVDLGPARQRCVLAALAIDAGRVVSADRLVERVWGADVPRRGRAVLHSYISRLRRVLGGAGGVAIERRSSGYALTAAAGPVVDLHRFRELCARARADTGGARVERLLGEALELWRGEALTGLDGAWAAAERDRLARERLAAQQDLVDVRLRLGHGGRLVGELAARTAAHPLDERTAGQYMRALHLAGRTADALGHYRRIRARLVEETGTEPGTALRALHQRLLTDRSTPGTGFPNTAPASAGLPNTGTASATPSNSAAANTTAADTGPTSAAPATSANSAATNTGPAGAATGPTPRQLPAAPKPFVGRRDDLDRLTTALVTALGDVPAGGTVVISAIAGAGGIGKTWLALHWAHRHADRYPDGQLFVDLRGFSPDSTPMDPAVAVRGFLDALGVEPGRVPTDPHAQAGLFRSLVADRRMLLVLDNAADTAQVTPLLPGSDTCTVLVTSRNHLPGLITAHGAHHLSLDVLDDDEARTLLADRLGAARVEAEPRAVDRLIQSCGGFPLALGIVAANAGTRPRLPLGALADELRDLGLGALDDDDPTASLPTVLSWSHRALTPDQLTAFALLGIAPGPDTGLPAVAALTGRPPAAARAVLRGLEQASLISQDTRGRFRMHDLVRRHAADTARTLPEDVRAPALRRVVDFYLHTADAADRLLDPHAPLVRLDPPEPGARPVPPADVPAALTWLDDEHRNLLATQPTAAVEGRHDVVWHLAWALETFHLRRGLRDDALSAWRAALDAAGHLADPTTLIRAHRLLGHAFSRSELHDEADGHLRRALALAEHHHDATEQAHTHRLLARAWGRRGDDRQALEHAERALACYRTLDRPAWEAQALNAVGWCAARLGEHDTGRAHCRAALALFRRLRIPDGEAAALDSLGWIDHRTGRHDQAVDHYRQALALFRDQGDTDASPDTLDGLGHPCVALGRLDEARAVWREAVELYRRQGREEDAARVQHQLDALDRTDGDRHPGSAP